jgi:CRISPR/Cas system CSM-associated protein Csm4 (group 5 of RAMP superfamily)
MEFEGQYLTYSEYTALGGTLDQSPFNILEFESRRLIDIYTQNRLKDSEEIPQEVKLCEFSMIGSLNSCLQATQDLKGNIASESIDGYSISYVTPNQVKEIISSKNVELTDTIRTYLLGVIFNDEHLLYVGRNVKQW